MIFMEKKRKKFGREATSDLLTNQIPIQSPIQIYIQSLNESHKAYNAWKTYNACKTYRIRPIVYELPYKAYRIRPTI